MPHAVLEKTGRLLWAEKTFAEAVKKTSSAKRLANGRQELLAHLKQIAQSDDLALIVAVERVIVQGDLEHYANSTQMMASLNVAMDELAAIERQIRIVADPEKYALVDQQYSLAKNREKGLPMDEGHQSLRSHYARLNNLDKSRLDEDEKQVIDARKAAFLTARRLYCRFSNKILVQHAVQDKRFRLSHMRSWSGR